MRFLQRDKIEKTILVISDLHLGAGNQVGNRKNQLEDFHCDQEFFDFLDYYSTGDYANREVELIINGDFLDLLAVPFVRYFDDEFWSEKSSLEKLKLIVEAHPQVIDALKGFIISKKKKVIYMLGNHDAEMVFDSLRAYLIEQFPEHSRENFQILLSDSGEYSPIPGLLLKHGHEYEAAHSLQFQKAIIEAKDGTKYFLPPWGSYYVTRVINKFKEERSYIHAVRPIRKFIINGFIYDTLFTLRFIFANFFYFFMVRFVYLFKQTKKFKEITAYIKQELHLFIFNDEESLLQEYFQKNEDLKILIVGHTHIPVYNEYLDGPLLINTGTWTKMYNLDFGMRNDELMLTYAQVDVTPQEEMSVALNVWNGRNNLPFSRF